MVVVVVVVVVWSCLVLLLFGWRQDDGQVSFFPRTDVTAPLIDVDGAGASPGVVATGQG